MLRSSVIRAGVVSVLLAMALTASYPVLAADEAGNNEPAKKAKKGKKHRKGRGKENAMSKTGAASWKIGTQAYTFHKYSLFEAIDKAKELGLKYIEIYPGQKLSPDQPKVKFDHSASKELRDEVKAKLKKADVTAVSFGVVRIKDEAEGRKVFDFARDMGMETVVSEPEDTPATWDLLDKLTQEYKINLAIHNHPKAPASHYWDPKTVLKVVKGRNPRIGACADIGHWMRSGVDPMEALKMLEGRIIELHFKDLNEATHEGHDLPWGKGKAKVNALLTELNRQKFSGLFCIEYEHNWTSSMPEIAESIKYFNQVKQELAAEHK